MHLDTIPKLACCWDCVQLKRQRSDFLGSTLMITVTLAKLRFDLVI